MPVLEILRLLFITMKGIPLDFPGGYAMASPCVLKDLGAYGFNVFSIANNHAMDYCHKGLEATIHHLDKAGQIYVGGQESC